jgi:hypothetical protein
MQRLEVSGAVRPLKWPLGVKWLNPICYLLALLGGATIVVVSRLRVKCRSQWPRSLRRGSAGSSLADIMVSNPTGDMDVRLL